MRTAGQLWQVLSALPAWQVTEVPRPDTDDPSAWDEGVAQRVQALASAHGAAKPVALAWLRDRAGGPVRVLAAGPALPGAEDGGQAVLTLPPGARAVPLPEGNAAQMLASLPCWTRIAGINDVLLTDGQLPAGMRGPTLEDGLLSAWLDAFGWLVLAEPVDEQVTADQARDAARAQQQAELSKAPRSRLAARRFEARHEELRQATVTGLWRVHLLSGAADPAACTRVARLVCASADLRGLPYALSPRQVTGSLPDALLAVTAPKKTHEPSLPDARTARGWQDQPIGGQGISTGWGTPAMTRPTSADGSRWPSPELAESPAEAFAREEDERDAPDGQSPFFAGSALVGTLVRAPVREVPGLVFRLRPDFDVTPETSATAGIAVGAVLDRNRVPAGTLTIPLESLNRHAFVTGSTGAGKSQTVRHLLEQATAAGVAWLVVEPAKAEYKLMAARLPGTEVIRIRPGELSAAAAGLNPLEPAAGPDGSRFPLQVHADLLRELFLAAFAADEPFPQVLAAGLTRTYEQAGWDLVSGEPTVAGAMYPGLEDLQAAALAVVDDAGYGQEVRDNVRGFVAIRIGSLRLGTAGRFLDGGHPLSFGALLARNVVLEIEDAGDDHDRAFLMGAVLIRLTEHLRIHARHNDASPSPGLRHLTVVEEAHRLLRQPPPGSSGPAAHAVEMFADLLAEIRAYGEGLIISEQIPSKLIVDVVKNTAVKVAHRLPAADDRSVVGATMNLTEAQSRYLVTLPPGEAAVHADGMDYALLARMPDGTDRESSGAATAVSPEAVIGRRSLTCGADCLTRACTLAEMRAAQRVTSAVTLWAELAVVAHLTGWTIPRATRGFLAELRTMQPRLRDCALSHAVDAAVAARVPAIGSRVSPVALATHVTQTLREVCAEGRRPCTTEEPEFLAPPFQWVLVKESLASGHATRGTPRHPRSAEWEATYGRPIPGRTLAAQLVAVNRWDTAAQSDTASVTAVLWGTRPHPAIERAVGSRRKDAAWETRLDVALTAFTRPQWPRRVFGVQPGE
jgi:hypothetical protein